MSEAPHPQSPFFVWRHGHLHAENVDLGTLAADVGTPLFVYSGAAIDAAYQDIDHALRQGRHLVAYAMKANGNLSLLSRLARQGCGADIVSGGELARALKSGIPGERIVFSGVGKGDAELQAALEAGIRSIHVESASELDVLEAIARDRGGVAPICLRVNPDVDPETHPYISTGLHQSKFGLELGVARELLPRILQSEHLALEGLACHIGSQLSSPRPIGDAVAIVAAFAKECVAAGATLRTLDAGGGWPVHHPDTPGENAPFSEFGHAIFEGIRRAHADDLGLEVVVEPGRSLVGSAGLLLTRVVFVKQQAGKRFVIVDAAMTELIRPALYQAYHAVTPVLQAEKEPALQQADVVGPVCETGDFLALGRPLPPLQRGDLLAVHTAGAYASSMASQYNARPRAAEVLVDRNDYRVIRRRDTFEDLWRNEV